MTTLSKRKQSKLLTAVINIFKKVVSSDSDLEFICCNIEKYAHKNYGDCLTCFDADKVIPSFNIENITRICQENNLTIPQPIMKGGAWWHIRHSKGTVDYAGNNKVRLDVLRILRKELNKN